MCCCWIVSSSLTRRDYEFLESCRLTSRSKNIRIIDETDPNYFLFAEEDLPIPKIIEDKKIRKTNDRNSKSDEIKVVEYISAMSKEHLQLSRKQVVVVTQKNKKKKK